MSINDLLKSVSKLERKAPDGKLYNPDIPEGIDDRDEIRSQSMSILKQNFSEPRNGNYFRLPKNRFSDNIKLDKFLQNGSIDPNVIRKRVDPDSARPTLRDSESTLFSLVPENMVSYDFNDLISKANQSYSNYKNRHERYPDTTPDSIPFVDPAIESARLSATATAKPLSIYEQPQQKPPSNTTYAKSPNISSIRPVSNLSN